MDCSWCGTSFEQGHFNGRVAKFCSKRCYDFDYGKRNHQRLYEVKKRCSKAYREKYRKSVWKSELRSLYGLTEGDYNAMLEKQEHRCGICLAHVRIISRRLAGRGAFRLPGSLPSTGWRRSVGLLVREGGEKAEARFRTPKLPLR